MEDLGLTAQEEKAAWAGVTPVTVTHNSAAVIGDCLKAMAGAERVIVIDNASTDDTLQRIRAVRPDAEIIRNETGLGYGNAANQGLARVESEFVLLINPDAVIDAAMLRRLRRTAEDNPRAAMIAPRLLNPDGSAELSYNADYLTRQRMSRSARSRAILPEGPCCTWYISGAVTLVRMAALRESGFYDPAIFLYFEDNDLCRRLIGKGWQLILDPRAEAMHIGGGSIGDGAAVRWEKFYHLSWSRLYFEAKYAGAGAAHRLGWRVLLRRGLKALGHGLVLNRDKARRDLASFCGAAAWLAGRPASRTTDRARPAMAAGGDEDRPAAARAQNGVQS